MSTLPLPAPRLAVMSKIAALLMGAALACTGLRGETLPATEKFVSSGRRIDVGTTSALRDAVTRARPGDEILVAPGEYALDRELMIRVEATEAQPVTIKCATPGAAKLTGEETIFIRNARWVLVEGFTFAHRLLPKRAWVRVLDSEHIRVSRCRFAADESGATEKMAYNSIGIEHATSVRVDHCDFGPRDSRSTGDYIATHVGSRFLRFDHNYFRPRANIGQNGGETVLLHGAGVWAHQALVDHNLFEQCNGEGELIGIKSSRNTVRANTFISCQGAISIRDGSYNRVEENIILNLLPENDPNNWRVSGVRIFGTHNEVVNNYMYRLAVPVQGSWGDADPLHEDDGDVSDRRDYGRDLGYIASHDNLIAHNTFVAGDCVFSLNKTGIAASYVFPRIEKVIENAPIRENLAIYREHLHGDFVTPHLAPRAWTFLNNLSFESKARGAIKIAREAQPPYEEEDFRYFGNIHHATKPLALPDSRRQLDAQWQDIDPKLIERGRGLYELAPDSPLRRQARHDHRGLETWTGDGARKVRLEALKDIGANIPVRPLTPADVGLLSTDE